MPAGPLDADAPRPAGRAAATPEFGPRGYLPERAARRARKIVLRAPLGLAWVVGSLVAGVAVLVAGVLLLGRGDTPPGPPWVDLGPVAALPTDGVDPATGLLLVTVGGRLRALEAPEGTRYCAATNRLEHPDGRVWALTGRGSAGTPSLPAAPTLSLAGRGYVDPTARVPGLEPLLDAAAPGCRD
jgi:hypothetical protein